jgi:hypothetical protein
MSEHVFENKMSYNTKQQEFDNSNAATKIMESVCSTSSPNQNNTRKCETIPVIKSTDNENHIHLAH